MKNILKRATRITVIVLASLTLAWAKAPNLTATLAPAEIEVGEVAQLTVTISGRGPGELQIPAVNGLEFQPVGQSSQVQVINGTMSANIHYTYEVVPTRAGNFTIPPIKLGRGAQAAMSQPILLKVGGGAGGGVPSGNRSNQSALPAPTVNGEAEPVSAGEQRSFGFLRLVTPRNEFYVGEMVPVELKAYFRAGVELRLDGLPKLNSDAFTMNKLGDEPVSSQQVIHGERYAVYTWPTVITAVKAGDYNMSVEIPITLTVRPPAQRSRPRMGNPFGDPFFDDMLNNFFGRATQKQIALNSEPNPVKILSLPGENRPAGFSGAVGQFDLTAEAVPTQTAAGDPVTLKLKISGAGNFDRVTAPAVEKSEVWKTYQPRATFEPSDSDGYSGTKQFEQTWVPMRAGELDVPALAFSYFDPQQKQYVTRTTSPVRIAVAPGQATATIAPPADVMPPTTAIAAAAASDLASDKAKRGLFTATLRPWFAYPWFVAGALLLSLTVLGASFLLRHRRQLARDPRQVRAAYSQGALRAQLQTMERAAARGDTGSFFAAACAAFQNLLGLRWSLPPRTITLTEINARLNGEADGLRTIFGLADEAIYAGRGFAPDELRQLQALVNHELRKLEAL